MLAVCALCAGCAGADPGVFGGPDAEERAPDRAVGAAGASLDRIAAELESLAPYGSDARRATYRAVLADTLAKDAYSCSPSPRELFFGDTPEGQRRIGGTMPHYGLFHGPMSYVVARSGGRFHVSLTIAVEPPPVDATLELPDCALARVLAGPVVCRGTPYAQAPGTDACPSSGTFTAPATRQNIRALLGRWSTEVERYYNRDAARFRLPIDYDFDVVVAGERDGPIDLELPLSPSCGRTPYFSALRSGWSLPVVAHELGHVLGLLDEYETFSGIARVYPKTPFPGAEVSRMGLSMKEETLLLPIHHYLVVRRYACAPPSAVDPFEHVLP